MSTMPWHGEAVVHCSIVNWIKGLQPGPKRLFAQQGNKAGEAERLETVDLIGPSLSFDHDVSKAVPIKANKAEGCYQGQTHGHKGFLLKADAAQLAIATSKDDDLSKVLRT